MAEALIPEVIPGLVAVKYTGSDNKETGEKKGAIKTVFPIDAKELLMSGDYELVENGSVEAARINANPLRSLRRNSENVVAEVTGIAGEVWTAPNQEEADKLVKAADHGGEPTEARRMDTPQPQVARAAETKEAPASKEPAKAAGTPTGAKSDSEKK